jgi:hypothetical protein
VLNKSFEKKSEKLFEQNCHSCIKYKIELDFIKTEMENKKQKIKRLKDQKNMFIEKLDKLKDQNQELINQKLLRNLPYSYNLSLSGHESDSLQEGRGVPEGRHDAAPAEHRELHQED